MNTHHHCLLIQRYLTRRSTVLFSVTAKDFFFSIRVKIISQGATPMLADVVDKIGGKLTSLLHPRSTIGKVHRAFCGDFSTFSLVQTQLVAS